MMQYIYGYGTVCLQLAIDAVAIENIIIRLTYLHTVEFDS